MLEGKWWVQKMSNVLKHFWKKSSRWEHCNYSGRTTDERLAAIPALLLGSAAAAG
jgi:hypothetical protein